MNTLTVTDSALARLAGTIRNMQVARSADGCFRLMIDEQGELELGIHIAVPGGKIFQHDGVTVLVMSDAVAEQHAGRTLDVIPVGDFVLG